jgi:hypothetical protein
MVATASVVPPQRTQPMPTYSPPVRTLPPSQSSVPIFEVRQIAPLGVDILCTAVLYHNSNLHALAFAQP